MKTKERTSNVEPFGKSNVEPFSYGCLAGVERSLVADKEKKVEPMGP